MEQQRTASQRTTRIGGIVDRDRLVLLGWTGLLTTTVVAVGAWDGGVLATPALTDLHAWPHWFAATDPATTAFALLRLLVLVVGWYLTGVTTLGILARLVRSRPLVRLADAITVPALRQVLQAAVGVGVATAVVGVAATPPLPALAAAATSGAPVVAATTPRTPLWDPVPETATVVVPPALDADSLRPRARHPRSQPSPASERAPLDPTVPDDAGLDRAPLSLPALDIGALGDGRVRPDPDPTDTAAEAPRDETWVVQPGEHFWAIAEGRVTAASRHTPTEDQVAGYWRRLIEANRSVLAIPDEPDLLFPGQVLTLPPVAPSG